MKCAYLVIYGLWWDILRFFSRQQNVTVVARMLTNQTSPIGPIQMSLSLQSVKVCWETMSDWSLPSFWIIQTGGNTVQRVVRKLSRQTVWVWLDSAAFALVSRANQSDDKLWWQIRQWFTHQFVCAPCKLRSINSYGSSCWFRSSRPVVVRRISLSQIRFVSQQWSRLGSGKKTLLISVIARKSD